MQRRTNPGGRHGRGWQIVGARVAAVLTTLLLVLGVASGEEDEDAPPEFPVPASEAVYLSPCPVAATVRQGNGGSFSHTGASLYAWDFMLPVETPILAARSGVVLRVKSDSAVGGSERVFGPHGNYVTIDHGDETGATYLHLVHGGVRVRVGEYVLQGEVLGLSGDTGWSTDAHLHYAVVKVPWGGSLPSVFRDFDANGGVPEQGQALQPAPPPVIPQATLELYKDVWRRVEVARALGRTALAWRAATSLPSRRRVADYYYEACLVAREAALRRAFLDEVAAWCAEEAPSDAVVLRAQEALLILARTKDEEIREARERLSAWKASWPEETTKAWRRESTALKAWVGALEAEVANDAVSARKAYATALGSARGPLRSFVDAALRRQVASWARALDQRLARRGMEVGIVQKSHHKRWLEQDLKDLRTEAQRLRKLQARASKDASTAAKADYDRREAERRRLLRVLADR